MQRLKSKRYLLVISFVLMAVIVLLQNQPAAAQTYTFLPEADAFVSAQDPQQSYGSLSILRAQASPQRRTYLRFRVLGLDGPVSHATLRLYAMDTRVYNFQVHRVTNNSWNEATLTYNNAPSPGTVIATYNASVNAGTWIEIDVTSFVTGGGRFSFALASSSDAPLRWQSRENNYDPELFLTTNSGGATATPTSPPQPTRTVPPLPSPTSTPLPPPSGNIIVDHNSVALFEQIPEQYIQAAANLDMLFVDRSVGSNISDGLGCLAFSTDEQAPSHCKRFTHVDPDFSVAPGEVNWNRPGGYDRSRWDYETWPTGCDNWYDKLDCFFDIADPVIAQYDVVSFQYSYLEVTDDSSIANQPGGFFSNNPTLYDVYELEAYEAQHPQKQFIYWTTSLARGIGTGVSDSFNEQMREYTIQNEKILFDVADILAHTPNGTPCYDNRDGIPYNNNSSSENYPDDGQALLAICPHYTTEVDGGHLGSVSAGKIRVAKAFWVLMAQIAGWDGAGP